MSVTGAEESTDYSKLKVPDLKKLLKSRGLSVVGNKQELIDRLHTSEAAAEALLEGSEVGDHFDEELERELDLTPLEDQKSEITPEIKEKNDDKPKDDKSEIMPEIEKIQDDKNVKINLKNVDLSPAARKQARAERFGNSTKIDKTYNTIKPDSTTSIATTPKATAPTNDQMKKRAERFGILSPVDIKRQHLEKLQARKMRFSQSTSDDKPTSEKRSAPITTAPIDERKRLRMQRFKVTA